MASLWVTPEDPPGVPFVVVYGQCLFGPVPSARGPVPPGWLLRWAPEDDHRLDEHHADGSVQKWEALKMAAGFGGLALQTCPDGTQLVTESLDDGSFRFTQGGAELRFHMVGPRWHVDREHVTVAVLRNLWRDRDPAEVSALLRTFPGHGLLPSYIGSNELAVVFVEREMATDVLKTAAQILIALKLQGLHHLYGLS